jgi:hypothetical protein
LDSLDVTFRLLDRVTPTLDVMDRHLAATKQSLGAVDKALRDLDRAEKQARFANERDPMKRYRLGLELSRDRLAELHGASAGVDGALGGLGLRFGFVAGFAMQAANAITSVAGAAARSAIDVGLFAVRSASFKRDAMTALEVIEGDAAGAETTFGRLAALADKSPFKTSDVIEFGQTLRSTGFTLRETEDLLAGMFDVGAMQGSKGPEQVRRLLEGITKVRGMDVLNMDTLREQIVGAGGRAGLNMPAVFAAIAKSRHTTIDQARALVSSGAIKGQEGVNAILDAIQTSVDKGGPLGKATREFGRRSLDGQLSTFSSRLEQIFYSVSIQPLVDIFQRLNDLLDSNSPTGRRIQDFAKNVLGGMFRTASSLLTADNIEKALNGVGDTVDRIGTLSRVAQPLISELFTGIQEGLDEATLAGSPLDDLLDVLGIAAKGENRDAWREFGRALGDIAGAAVTLGKVLLWIDALLFSINGLFVNIASNVPLLGTVVHGLKALRGVQAVRTEIASHAGGMETRAPRTLLRAKDVGFDAAHGLAVGMNDGAAGVTFAADALAARALDTTAKSLDIHSPSRAMRRLGLETARGFEEGVHDGEADAALREMVSPSSSGATPAASRGPVTVQVSVGDVHVHGTDTARAAEVGREVRASIQAELIALLEEMGLA